MKYDKKKKKSQKAVKSSREKYKTPRKLRRGGKGG